MTELSSKLMYFFQQISTGGCLTKVTSLLGNQAAVLRQPISPAISPSPTLGYSTTGECEPFIINATVRNIFTIGLCSHEREE